MRSTLLEERPPNGGGKLAFITCPRCQTECPNGVEQCTTCGRHFVVYCGACGHRNPREAVRCEACLHQLRVRRRHGNSPPLHRLVWPLKWDWRHKPRWVLPAQIGAFVLTVFLGVQALLLLHAKLAMPQTPPEEPDQLLRVLPDGPLVELPSEDFVRLDGAE